MIMRKTITLIALCLFITGNAMGQFNLLFNQPYFDGGTAATSAFDTVGTVDYEAADNFSGLTEPIEEIIFYGLTLKHNGTSWVEQVPGTTEPFFIRFYDYEEGVTPGLEAPVTGTYQIALVDDYGDGWNGGLVSVFVNGSIVLTDLTIIDGFGPEYHNFSANAGDYISTIYTAGEWSSENYYAILDPGANIIAEDGGTWADPGVSTPLGIAPGGQPMVLEPDWANPEDSQFITATVENIGTVWGAAYQLYKFTATLTSAVNRVDGWVSVQIDANNGSGTWFLWLNSQAGDGVSFQRTAPLRGQSGRDMINLASVSMKGDGGLGRDLLAYDFGLELWGGELSDPPPCVTNPIPADVAEGIAITTNLSWTGTPLATGYKIYFGTDNPPTDITNGTDLGLVTSYTPPAVLAYGTKYFWMVVAYNDEGDAIDCSIWSFTSQDDPTIYPPYTQNFNTTPFPPASWATRSGILTASSTLVAGQLWFHHWFGNVTGATGTENSAYVNIYQTRNHWLITPPINLGAGSTDYRLKFDIALTPWTGITQSTLGPDDYVAVVISTDNGVTWSNANVLIDWDDTDVILPTGNNIIIPLTGYSGVVQFGFYAERTTTATTPDLRFYVDNVTVEEAPETPIFSITPSSWDFGDIEVGFQSAPKVFTISNAGPGTLTVSAPILDNNVGFTLDFEATDYPAELEGAETVTFNVVFHPQSTGPAAGDVSISYDDTEAIATVPLSGEGVVRPAGSTCGNPYPASLPLVAYANNTEAYGNDYQGTWVTPSTNYLNGYDFVAQFTLTEAGYLSGSVAGSWTGVIIVQDCPDPVTPASVLALGSGSNGGSFLNVLLSAGTYFAIVSTYPTPNFTAFTLNLSFEPLPLCPTPTTPTVTAITNESAQLGWTENGSATMWDIEYGVSPYTFTGTPTISGVTNPYLLSGLDPSTTYQFKVRSDCGGEQSEWSATQTFTTLCDVYNLPLSETFDAATFPPQCWSRYSGLLTDPVTLTTSTLGWISDDWLNIASNPDKAAKINIYGAGRYFWLVSPLLDLGDGSSTFGLSFDLALMTWNTSNPPQTNGTDDVFAVVISTDGGVTWTSANTLRLWDNAGSPYVFNDINYMGEQVIISLDGYTGVVQIGLYGGSTIANADNDLMVNNFTIQELLYPITFNLDMSTAAGFDHDTEAIYIAGDFPGATWNQPGSNPNLQLSRVDLTDVYTITLDLPPASYEYKYFRNAGWDGGEWTGGSNRTIVVDGIVETEDVFGGDITWANLQWPENGTITEGGSFVAYGQAYIPNGITGTAGAAFGLEAWVGISTDDADPSGWSTWVPATFNSQAGDNDEFLADIAPGLTPGTYYYAYRYRFGEVYGEYLYGGYNGGFWDGSTNVSGILTVNAGGPPPSILVGGPVDDCLDATDEVAIVSATVENGAMADIRSGGIITATAFEVKDGGTAYLTATTSIILGDEVLITPGATGLFLAKIDTFEPCVLPLALVASVEEVIPEIPAATSLFKIFPNPTTGSFKLELTGIEETSAISVEIFGMMGEKVFQDRLFGSMLYDFDLSNMPKGIYFIRVLKGDEMGIEKVIKQ
jgi:hypothetical protein